MLAMIPEAGGSSVEVVAGQQGRQLVQEVLRSVTQSCLILCDPCTVARQAPLSVGFSRQEHWTGLPCPPPGDLPDQESHSYLRCLLHLQAGSFTD